MALQLTAGDLERMEAEGEPANLDVGRLGSHPIAVEFDASSVTFTALRIGDGLMRIGDQSAVVISR